MALLKPSCSVLVVSSSDKGADVIMKYLDPTKFTSVTAVKNAGEASRNLISGTYDTIIINSPLTDEFGHELALYAAENSASGIILIAKSEIFDELSSRMEPYGVLTIAKPISASLFHQALSLMTAKQERLKRVEIENAKLRSKIDEIKIVNRAKCTLIQYLNMTEAAAHRYIEKQAMDMRATKVEIAEKILKMYED
jgi:response regulator NasT